MNKRIELGWKVKDVVTEFEGIAVTRLESIDGGIDIGVQPITRDGKQAKIEYIPDVRLQKIDDGIHIAPVRRTIGFLASKE